MLLSDFNRVVLVILVMGFIWTAPIKGSTTRNLDENTPTSGTGVKCTPCEEHPPPPPPPATPTTQNCPPPPVKTPPSPLYYITGPPGNLYPYDPYYSGSRRNSITGILPIILVGYGFLLAL